MIGVLYLLDENSNLNTDEKRVYIICMITKESENSLLEIEVFQYKLDITYRPGKQNIAADMFSRIAAAGHPLYNLYDLQEQFSPRRNSLMAYCTF